MRSDDQREQTPPSRHDREVGILKRALESAVRGRGRMVLVSGESGSGKTLLAERISIVASESGLESHWGRPAAEASTSPYRPWMEILRSLDASPSVTAEFADDFSFFDAATKVIRQAAAVKPRLVVLDDVHAADLPSLRLLQFLGRQIRDIRLVVVATYRESDVLNDPKRRAVLDALGCEPTRIPLRLSKKAVRGTADAKRGRVIPEPSARGTPERIKPSSEHPRRAVRREGDFWNIFFGAEQLRIRHSNGVVYLTELLRNASTPIHILELSTLSSTGAKPRLERNDRDRLRQRLRDVQEQLDEALALNDVGRSKRLRTLLEGHIAEFLEARHFDSGEATNLVRVNVQRAIARTIRTIAGGAPGLGRHLTAAIRTGIFCRYVPESSAAGGWEIG